MAAASAPRPATTLITRPAYPPAEDVALGVVSVIADRAWRAGSWGIAMATGITMRAADVVRAISPTFATEMADARLAALAERGRAMRAERSEALSAVVSNAITNAATSDAMRQMSVAAIEEATDDVLAVVLPAMLEAVTELETQDKLDELMAGLLLRQLPSALEKTLPGVMMRTATKPAAGLNAFLSGVLPRPLTHLPRQDSGVASGRGAIPRDNRVVTLHVVTANVNGIRAALRRGGLDWLASSGADVLCLQEVRATSEQADEVLGAAGLGDWHLALAPGAGTGTRGWRCLPARPWPTWRSEWVDPSSRIRVAGSRRASRTPTVDRWSGSPACTCTPVRPKALGPRRRTGSSLRWGHGWLHDRGRPPWCAGT